MPWYHLHHTHYTVCGYACLHTTPLPPEAGVLYTVTVWLTVRASACHEVYTLVRAELRVYVHCSARRSGSGAGGAGSCSGSTVGGNSGEKRSEVCTVPGTASAPRGLPIGASKSEAADQPPQYCRDVAPVPGQQYHVVVAADPRVEENMPRRCPVPHVVVNQPARGRTDVWGA